MTLSEKTNCGVVFKEWAPFGHQQKAVFSWLKFEKESQVLSVRIFAFNPTIISVQFLEQQNGPYPNVLILNFSLKVKLAVFLPYRKHSSRHLINCKAPHHHITVFLRLGRCSWGFASKASFCCFFVVRAQIRYVAICVNV